MCTHLRSFIQADQPVPFMLMTEHAHSTVCLHHRTRTSWLCQSNAVSPPTFHCAPHSITMFAFSTHNCTPLDPIHPGTPKILSNPLTHIPLHAALLNCPHLPHCHAACCWPICQLPADCLCRACSKRATRALEFCKHAYSHAHTTTESASHGVNCLTACRMNASGRGTAGVSGAA